MVLPPLKVKYILLIVQKTYYVHKYLHPEIRNFWNYRTKQKIMKSKLALAVSMRKSEKETCIPASILYRSIAGRIRPVSYPDGPITARCRFIKNAYWDAFIDF